MIKHLNNSFNMQVKIFRTNSTDPAFIEEKVNNFLAQPNIILKDIKTSSDEHGFWVTVMYETSIIDF